MAFTLRITFSGLCLFVPEASGGGTTGRMHVLMPGMFGHHHAGADRHVPVTPGRHRFGGLRAAR